MSLRTELHSFKIRWEWISLPWLKIFAIFDFYFCSRKDWKNFDSWVRELPTSTKNMNYAKMVGFKLTSCAGYPYNLFPYSTDSRIKHLLVLQLLWFTVGILAYLVKAQLFSPDMRHHTQTVNLKHRQTGLKWQIRMRQTLGGNTVAVTHKYIWVQALIFLRILVVYLFSLLDLKNFENKRSETGKN